MLSYNVLPTFVPEIPNIHDMPCGYSLVGAPRVCVDAPFVTFLVFCALFCLLMTPDIMIDLRRQRFCEVPKNLYCKCPVISIIHDQRTIFWINQ